MSVWVGGSVTKRRLQRLFLKWFPASRKLPRMLPRMLRHLKEPWPASWLSLGLCSASPEAGALNPVAASALLLIGSLISPTAAVVLLGGCCVLPERCSSSPNAAMMMLLGAGPNSAAVPVSLLALLGVPMAPIMREEAAFARNAAALMG